MFKFLRDIKYLAEKVSKLESKVLFFDRVNCNTNCLKYMDVVPLIKEIIELKLYNINRELNPALQIEISTIKNNDLTYHEFTMGDYVIYNDKKFLNDICNKNTLDEKLYYSSIALYKSLLILEDRKEDIKEANSDISKIDYLNIQSKINRKIERIRR